MVTFSNFDMKKFYGLSTDTKPTSEVPVGSEFTETDTKAKYQFNGTSWGTMTLGRVNSMPYGYDVAEGNIAEHVPFLKMGIFTALSTSDIDIWEGGSVYSWLTAAQTVSIVSSQANDSSSGSGVRTIYINYLDSAGVTGRETVTMQGTSAVTSTNTMYRINSVVVATTGGAYAATGTITISKSAGGTGIAYIQPGQTKSRMCIYTVPAGKTVYITSVTYGLHSAQKGARFITRATYDADNNELKEFFLPYADIAMGNGAFQRMLDVPTRLPAGTRLKVSAIADAAGALCSAVLRGWIEVD
jgi:hypothetical protein